MKLPTAEQLDAFRRLGAATVHEAQGRTGALDSAITPLDPTSLLAGTALTVDCRPGDNLAIQYAVTIAQPGDVLVVDAKGYAEGGAWGDLLTLAAQQAGVAGLVIDGSARDSRSIIDMGFPVFFARHQHQRYRQESARAVGGPIVCGGVAIRAGDLIVGDAYGVVAVPAQLVQSTLELAAQRAAAEERTRNAILDGRTLVDVLV